MCGIVCAFELKQTSDVIRPKLLEMSKTLRHRGPDWSGIYSSENAVLVHERLAIVDPTSGKQPLISPSGNLVLAANGEIYNHRELRALYESSYGFKTQSDCEVILALYENEGPSFVEKLNGIFAFAIFDETKNEYFIARDHMGIIPLYMGWDGDGTFYVASELKALEGVCSKIELFPPGHYFHSNELEPTAWYKPDWKDFDNVKNNFTS
ncbi:MAG: asparagine synthase B, partial [Flavobacteriaceae bacterium]|nr:asparagine synthase B [Flavobacteriaceae bacterium]